MIWYASYGSNLNEKRFLCYIKGGKPEFSQSNYPGCRDKTVPVASQKVIIPHEMYFSRSSGAWQQGAVAFIKSVPGTINSLGRMYLITKEQFLDVIKQENGYKSSDDRFKRTVDYAVKHNISYLNDLEPAMQEDSNSPKWYGRIVNLGEEQGFPILTFTAEWDDAEAAFNKPHITYLKTIAAGLKEGYPSLTDDDIADYFITRKGLAGVVSKKEMQNILGQKIKY